MKVIYLDIDGVLNHPGTYGDPGAPWRAPSETDDPSEASTLLIPIAPECIARLNRLIEETGAVVVISSSWRLFARWQDLGPALVRHGLVGEVVGETPDLVNDGAWLNAWRTREGAPFAYERMERGWEIREHLGAHIEPGPHVLRPPLPGAVWRTCQTCDEEIRREDDVVCHESAITHFVILDDCSDAAELRPWLVLTDPVTGLDDPDVERAKYLLERSAEGIALARSLAIGCSMEVRNRG